MSLQEGTNNDRAIFAGSSTEIPDSDNSIPVREQPATQNELHEGMAPAASRNPTLWWQGREDWENVASAERNIATRSLPPVIVSKAGQLEAEILDQELADMLKDQLGKVFSLLKPSVVVTFGPELDALFRCVIFSYSVWTNRPTPGNMFQNLVYSDDSKGTNPSRPAQIPLTKRQRILHAFLYVLLPWAWARSGHALSSWGWGTLSEGSWRRRVWTWYQRMESALKHASLANFLLFLINGKYRSIADRLIKIRLLHADASMTRSLNLDYVGHFLAWQSFIQLLNFLRPIVSRNAGGVRRRIARATGWASRPPQVMDRPIEACQACGALPANAPHAPACGHVYCYYCLRANMLAQPAMFACLRCNAVARTCTPVMVHASDEQSTV